MECTFCHKLLLSSSYDLIPWILEGNMHNLCSNCFEIAVSKTFNAMIEEEGSHLKEQNIGNRSTKEAPLSISPDSRSDKLCAFHLNGCINSPFLKCPLCCRDVCESHGSFEVYLDSDGRPNPDAVGHRRFICKECFSNFILEWKSTQP